MSISDFASLAYRLGPGMTFTIFRAFAYEGRAQVSLSQKVTFLFPWPM